MCVCEYTRIIYIYIYTCIYIYIYTCIYIYINTCVCVYWYACCLWCGVQHVHTIIHYMQKHVWFSKWIDLTVGPLMTFLLNIDQWTLKAFVLDFPGVLQLHQGSSICIWTPSSSQTPRRNHALVRVVIVHIFGDGSKPWYPFVHPKIAGIYGCSSP